MNTLKKVSFNKINIFDIKNLNLYSFLILVLFKRVLYILIFLDRCCAVDFKPDLFWSEIKIICSNDK